MASGGELNAENKTLGTRNVVQLPIHGFLQPKNSQQMEANTQTLSKGAFGWMGGFILCQMLSTEML